MNEKEIIQIFEKFSSMRAIVIGDVMLDTYLRGNVERMSPEASIPVVSVNKRESSGVVPVDKNRLMKLLQNEKI